MLFLVVSALTAAGALAGAVPAQADLHPANPSAAVASVLHEINAIRAGAHLPLGRLITRDDGLVLAAARADRDPVLPPLNGAGNEYGLWGIVPAATVRGTPDPSGVVRAWVYDDGWQGSHTINYDCTSPTARACNGHRRAVLSARPFNGAKLQIDVGVRSASLGSFNASSVAVLMIWTA